MVRRCDLPPTAVWGVGDGGDDAAVVEDDQDDWDEEERGELLLAEPGE